MHLERFSYLLDEQLTFLTLVAKSWTKSFLKLCRVCNSLALNGKRKAKLERTLTVSACCNYLKELNTADLYLDQRNSLQQQM